MSGNHDPFRDALFVIPPPPVPLDLDALVAANAALRAPVDGQLTIDQETDMATADEGPS